MLLRLKLYQLLLKITAYLLPFAGFHVGLRMWSFSWSLIGLDFMSACECGPSVGR